MYRKHETFNSALLIWDYRLTNETLCFGVFTRLLFWSECKIFTKCSCVWIFFLGRLWNFQKLRSSRETGSGFEGYSQAWFWNWFLSVFLHYIDLRRQAYTASATARSHHELCNASFAMMDLCLQSGSSNRCLLPWFALIICLIIILRNQTQWWTNFKYFKI